MMQTVRTVTLLRAVGCVILVALAFFVHGYLLNLALAFWLAATKLHLLSLTDDQ